MDDFTTVDVQTSQATIFVPRAHGQGPLCRSSLEAQQPRQFTETRATVASIDGVERFHEPRTSPPFDVG